jgi:CHAT domain-containing protein/tetratricopeptide (TPR) repeat protein
MAIRWVRWCFAFVFSFAVAAPALGQGLAEADKLNVEVSRLVEDGKYAEAIPIAQQILALREKMAAQDHPDVAKARYSLTLLYRLERRFPEAESLLKRAIAVFEKNPQADPLDLNLTLFMLAELYMEQRSYAQAEPVLNRARERSEAYFGSVNAEVAEVLESLCVLYTAQGRLVEAEITCKRVLEIREVAFGYDNVAVATSLNLLGLVFYHQQRFSDAAQVLARSLTIRESALGVNDTATADTLNNLGLVYQSQGRYQEAEPLQKRSLAIREVKLSKDHRLIAQSLNNLGALYLRDQRYEEAESAYQRSIAISEKAKDDDGLGEPLNNLADLYLRRDRHAEAVPLLKRALLNFEKWRGPNHPFMASALENLALSLTPSDLRAAAETWQRAAAVIKRRSERGLDRAPGQKSTAQTHDAVFKGLIKTTMGLVTKGRADAVQVSKDMFETAQSAQTSEAAYSLSQSAARSAGGSPALGALARERQDLVAEWQEKDEQLTQAKSKPPARRSATLEVPLINRLSAIDARLATIDTTFVKDFPDYAEMMSPKPVSVLAVQASLHADEAMILFLDTSAIFKPMPEETFVWIVTKTDMRWLRSTLGTVALAREVEALRCGLDYAGSWQAVGSNCRELTGVNMTAADIQGGKALPFDASRAHSLYNSLLGGAEILIKNKHLLIVPSGALTTLPFQVLVTQTPKSPDLAAAAWLVRDHAITVLPSVASIVALRRKSKPTTAPRPMIGFANPLLEGDQTHPEYGDWNKQQAALARNQTACAASPKKITAALRALSRSPRSVPQADGLADLEHLRTQAPLPETADEICHVARTLGAEPSEMRIGARATEAEVKRLSDAGELAKYRIVHFATHGTLAGQLSGTKEPGLILTPPKTGTHQDDGYLSGSEIARLKLDADWVILSACNTAGGAGEGQAAEALSGLARVFFYAGARALLVSHWEVDSDAAVKLVTGAVGALAGDKGLGRAEALRRAMLAVMSDAARPSGGQPPWHPAVWAPFAVVGEGSTDR